MFVNASHKAFEPVAVRGTIRHPGPGGALGQHRHALLIFCRSVIHTRVRASQIPCRRELNQLLSSSRDQGANEDANCQSHAHRVLRGIRGSRWGFMLSITKLLPIPSNFLAPLLLGLLQARHQAFVHVVAGRQQHLLIQIHNVKQVELDSVRW
jgi:hypothetical protein